MVGQQGQYFRLKIGIYCLSLKCRHIVGDQQGAEVFQRQFPRAPFFQQGGRGRSQIVIFSERRFAEALKKRFHGRPIYEDLSPLDQGQSTLPLGIQARFVDGHDGRAAGAFYLRQCRMGDRRSHDPFPGC